MPIFGGLVYTDPSNARKDGPAQLDNQFMCELPINLGTHQSSTLMGSLCVDRQPRHRFLEPIHNVKEGPEPRPPANRRISGLHLWKFLAAAAEAVVEPIGIEPMTSSLQS